jgi:hypothetical protein
MEGGIQRSRGESAVPAEIRGEPLPPDAEEQLGKCCAGLEREWRKHQKPVDLRRFLPSPGPLVLPCLHRLVAVDLGHRWQLGRRKFLEQYLAEFPELRPAAALPAELLLAEYRARHLGGGRPALEEYRRRFPAQFDQLAKLVGGEPFDEYPTVLPTGGGIPTPSFPEPCPPPPTRRRPAEPAAGAGRPADRSGRADGQADRLGAAPPPTPVRPAIAQPGLELGERLGGGAFGEVFRGWAPGGLPVAVKVISSKDCGRIELQALEKIKRLRHKYLLQTQSYFPDEHGRLCIVMEMADGTLAEWDRECKAAGRPGIGVAELVAYFKQAAEGLDYLHSQNLTHRDVKPANLLRLAGDAKVGDFGLLRVQGQALDSTQRPAGTPLYMAPEAWGGVVCFAGDQYSLAATYAELRQGRPIYPVTDNWMLFVATMSEKDPDVSGLTSAEQRVVRKALAREHAKRYPTCVAFVDALAEAVLPRPVAKPAPPEPPWRKALRRAAWVAAPLVVLAVALLLAYRSWKVEVPDGFVKYAEGGRRAEAKPVLGVRRWTWIRHRRDVGHNPLVFRLIEPSPSGGPQAAFYILENKVSRRQLVEFLRDPATQARMTALLDEHTKPGLGPGKAWEKLWAKVLQAENEFSRGDRNEDWPVTKLTPTEAYCFARCLGGYLPSGEEWDKAAGFYDGSKAPYRPEWAGGAGIAIRLPPGQFSPVGESELDESVFGCRDMGGNGFEWVCDLIPKERGTFPLADPILPDDPRRPDPDLVVRRGQAPTAREPFQFKPGQAAYYDAAPADTGFRVVLRLP